MHVLFSGVPTVDFIVYLWPRVAVFPKHDTVAKGRRIYALRVWVKFLWTIAVATAVVPLSTLSVKSRVAGGKEKGPKGRITSRLTSAVFEVLYNAA
ncbi:hypothetical protein B0H19DRAFT_1151038 [Mycena capillaripes]|nr:hypothetical protein B0H19DRAFT_1151038 [Mycena capillaripes]